MDARLQSASQYATNACGQKLVGCGKVCSTVGQGTYIEVSGVWQGCAQQLSSGSHECPFLAALMQRIAQKTLNKTQSTTRPTQMLSSGIGSSPTHKLPV